MTGCRCGSAPPMRPGGDAALLVEGDAPVPAGTSDGAVQAGDRAWPAIPSGCTCCVPRGPVAEALGRLFLARARGEVAFFRSVVAVMATPAGEAAVRAALARGSSLRGTLPAGAALTAARPAVCPRLAGMRVLVIYCHPVAESFAAAAHATVLEALDAAGHAVTDVDLYAEDFDPVMSRQDRLDYQNTARNDPSGEANTTTSSPRPRPSCWFIRHGGTACRRC